MNKKDSQATEFCKKMFPYVPDFSGKKTELFQSLEIWESDSERTPIIIGREGGGKTTLFKEYFEHRNRQARALGHDTHFHEMIIIRLQGVMPEDFKGIPRIVEKSNSTEGVEFIKFGEIYKILKKNDKRYLVIVDEINRAPENLMHILMPFLRKKIEYQGRVVSLDNVQIIAAANAGERFKTNIDFNKDGAIKRGITWLSYEASKKECIEFMKNNNYDNLTIEVASRLDYVSKYTNIKMELFEQSTNLGSWFEFDNMIKNLRKEALLYNKELSIDDVLFVFDNFAGSAFFDSTEQKKNTSEKIYDILLKIEEDLRNLFYSNENEIEEGIAYGIKVTKELDTKKKIEVEKPVVKIKEKSKKDNLIERLKLSTDKTSQKINNNSFLLLTSNNKMPKLSLGDAKFFLKLLKGTKTTPILVGKQGVGKSRVIEEFYHENRNRYHKKLEIDLRGIEDIDLKGIPRVKIHNDWVEFIKIGVLEEIKSNPDKHYLLVLDEIDRAPENIMPMLFQLLTKELDGLTFYNTDIIGAMNHGEDFAATIDFTSDSALLRRCTFIEIIPTKNEVIEFINKEKYHPTISKIMTDYCEKKKIFYFDVKEFEQSTNFGSWKSWNNDVIQHEKILKRNGKNLTIDEIQNRFANVCGEAFFASETRTDILFKLNEIKNKKDLSNIDFLEDIIKTGRIPDDFKDNGINDNEVLMALEKYIVRTITVSYEKDEKGVEKKRVSDPEEFNRFGDACVFSITPYAEKFVNFYKGSISEFDDFIKILKSGDSIPEVKRIANILNECKNKAFTTSEKYQESIISKNKMVDLTASKFSIDREFIETVLELGTIPSSIKKEDFFEAINKHFSNAIIDNKIGEIEKIGSLLNTKIHPYLENIVKLFENSTEHIVFIMDHIPNCLTLHPGMLKLVLHLKDSNVWKQYIHEKATFEVVK